MSGDPFYTSAAWRSLRRDVLRERGRCEVAGCPKQPKHVDHIKPRRQGGAPFDRANLRVLCWSHHSVKTAQSDGGFGNAVRAPVRLVVKGCDAAGNPLDRGHRWSAGRGVVAGMSPDPARIDANGDGAAYPRRRGV